MSRHPDPHLQAVIEYAVSKGWRVKLSKKGHAWGRLLCPLNEREGCIHSVNGTPRNPVGDARRLKKAIDNCPHQENENDDGNEEL